MPNPLFSMLGGNMPSMSGPMGNFAQMMQQFQQFRANFQGDPKAGGKTAAIRKNEPESAQPIAEYGETISAAYAQIRL